LIHFYKRVKKMMLSRMRIRNIVRYSQLRLPRLDPRYLSTTVEDQQSAFSNPGIDEALQQSMGDWSKRRKITFAGEKIIDIAKSSSPEDKIKLKSDKRFLGLVKYLESDLKTVEVLFLISSLKALKNIGLSEKDFAIQNIENGILWSLRSCSMKELLMSFTFSVSRLESSEEKINFEKLCTIIERRWIEIQGHEGEVFEYDAMKKFSMDEVFQSHEDEFTGGASFSLLLSHMDKLDDKLVAKIEDRLQDCVEELAPADLVSILNAYAKHNSRNKPVILSLSYHIAKNKNLLDIKQIADVLFAYKSLSFKDQVTIERISSQLENLIKENDNLAVTRSILSSLGKLKFASSTILNMICDWYGARLIEGKKVEDRDLFTLVRILAKLNHLPNDEDTFFKKVVEKLTYASLEAVSKRNEIWLETVWSLTVLNMANSEQIASVLDPSFIQKIGEGWGNSSERILNVNSASQLMGDQYKGEKLKADQVELFAKEPQVDSPAKTAFKNFFKQTLLNLFPAPRFVTENVTTVHGVTLDYEIIVDSQAKPIQVAPYMTTVASKTAAKALPVGASRVAILITPFQDCLLGGGMTGDTALAVRLLQNNGYVTLVCDFSTIDSTMKEVSRIQKLDVLIKQALKEQTSK